MQTYNFTLFLEGANLEEEDVLEQLFEAGCDDATFGQRDGAQFAEFDREAGTFSEAVISAIRGIEGAVGGLRVIRVEPDDLVTSSVIADRTGRSRQNVQQLIVGKRGPGNFPAPLALVGERTRLWRWGAVAEWFTDTFDESFLFGGAPQFTAALNGTLQARSQMALLSRIAMQSGPEQIELTRETITQLVTILSEGTEQLERELAAA